MIQVTKLLEREYFDTLGDAFTNHITFAKKKKKKPVSKILTVAIYSAKHIGHSLNISLNDCQKWN